MARIDPALTVREIQRAKEALQNQLAASVAQNLSAFQEITGFTPAAIAIDLIQSLTINGERPDYIVGKVHVDLDI